MHLGNSETVRDRDIIGIFDIEAATLAKSSRDFIRKMQNEMKTVSIAKDLPSAFVLTEEEFTDRIYITSLSAKVLSARTDIREEKNNGRKL